VYHDEQLSFIATPGYVNDLIQFKMKYYIVGLEEYFLSKRLQSAEVDLHAETCLNYDHCVVSGGVMLIVFLP
jgi:hypothetical protein